ncbi:MAG TPA: hypothetical protein VM513_35640, partial [Kofleriaceae bacterium]|nr:hypothetical protein [Kofleriaceae bacterium]
GSDAGSGASAPQAGSNAGSNAGSGSDANAGSGASAGSGSAAPAVDKPVDKKPADKPVDKKPVDKVVVDKPVDKKPADKKPRDKTPADGKGYLVVATDPPAKVAVDGVDTGLMTPILGKALPLTPGKHKITFSIGGVKVSYMVMIKAGLTETMPTKQLQ